MAAAFRKPVPPDVIRRRVSRNHHGATPQNTANLVLSVGLSAAIAIVLLLLYLIISGFLEALYRLFQ